MDVIENWPVMLHDSPFYFQQNDHEVETHL